MSDADAVLFANEAFYRAFADRDFEQMESVWSRAAPVSCLHPGWGPLHGREAVMRSWAAILGSADSPAIRALAPQASVLGDVALVTCFEALGRAYAVATNIFVREGSLWKLVHHQAGPTSEHPPAASDTDSPRPLH
jgi:ketosteroid isomerase-like protein